MAYTSTDLRPILVVHIESGSVGVSCGVREGGGAQLLWSKRVSFKSHGVDDYRRMEKMALAAALESLMLLMADGVNVYREHTHRAFREPHLVVVYGVPWIQSDVRSVAKTFDAPRTFSERELAEYYAREQEEFVKSEPVRDFSARTGAPHSLPPDVISAMVNGYACGTAQTKTGEKLELSLFCSVVPSSLQSKLEEVVSKTVPGTHVEHTATTPVLVRALEQQHERGTRYLLVETGSELTTVSYVVGSTIVRSQWFPVGVRHVVAGDAGRSKTDLEAATTLELAQLSGNGGGKAAPEGTAATWSRELATASSGALEGVTAPPLVYVAVERPLCEAFVGLTRGVFSSDPKQSIAIRAIGESRSAEPRPQPAEVDVVLDMLTQGLSR